VDRAEPLVDGPVDLAFLPIGAYAPRDTMRAFHMDPADAVQAQRDLEARYTVGIHFGTFQLTAEDFNQPILDLQHALERSPDLPGPFMVLPEGRTWIASLGAPRAVSGEPLRPQTR
ncbi:MAG: MBL fold metallo-hydrolase, partial [Myxococcota bacterium]